mmetsp:Transcript_33295/g.37223  ORF Transcript_33295/g.37223 Transcript_33295/m.37223 type:complete len:110 (-) Transcript_33295:509-838(-)
MLAYILDDVTDPDKEYLQDTFIASMYYAHEIRNIVAAEQYSSCERIRNRYIGALFENTIACVDDDVRGIHHPQDTTQGRSKQQLITNSMGKLDHQSHTSRLYQHTSRLN